MIVRNVAVRHGRAAAATPLSGATRQGLRSISTEPPSTSGLAHTSKPPTAPPPTGPVTPRATVAVPRVLDPRLQARFGQAKVEKAPDRTAGEYVSLQRWRRRNAKVGSAVERTYVPGDLIRDPPAPKDVTLELLMASQCHMGHHTSLWNPANARYIYGVRQDIHIISLEQTAAHLRRAARLVEEVAYCGGLILFAGTRRGHMEIVTRAAELSRACHLFTKWTPGTITNRDVILAGPSIKVVDENDRELPGFSDHLRDRRPLVPDLVVCMNPLENGILLHECVLEHIPTIGVIDTNADPTKVTYPIPANDDSLRSIAVICGVLGRAGQLGQARRLQDAKNGVVHWENPADVARFLGAANEAQAAQTKQEMADEQQREADLLASEEIKRLLM